MLGSPSTMTASTPDSEQAPIPVIIQSSEPDVNSASLDSSPSPSPARSIGSRPRWFSGIRKASSVRHVSSPSPAGSATIKGLPPSEAALSAPGKPMNIRPAIPRFTPPSTPPNGRAGSPSPSSSKMPTTVAAPGSLNPPEVDLSKSSIQDITPDPKDVPTSSPSSSTMAPVSRGWFGGSKVSLASTKTSPEVSGVEQTAPQASRPSGESTVNVTSETSDVPKSLPEADETRSTEERPVRTAPISRGWFGTRKASPASGSAASSVKGKEREQTSQTNGPEPSAQDVVPITSPEVPLPSPVTPTSAPSPDPPSSPPAASLLSSDPPPSRYALGLPLLGRRTRGKDADKAKESGTSAKGEPRPDGDYSKNTVGEFKLFIVGLLPQPRLLRLVPFFTSHFKDTVSRDVISAASASDGTTNATCAASLSQRPGDSGKAEAPSASIETPASAIKPSSEDSRPTDLPLPVQDAVPDPASSTVSHPQISSITSSAATNPDSTINSTTTWWNYLGLGGGPTAFPPPVRMVETPATDTPSPPLEQTIQSGRRSPTRSVSSARAKIFDPADRRRSTSRENASSADGGASAREGQTPKTDRVNNELTGEQVSSAADTGPERARSVTSGNPATTGWMGPLLAWAYPGSVNTTGDTGSENVAPAGEVKTEAELIKEEALRNSAANESSEQTTLPAEQEVEVQPEPVAVPNPVMVHSSTKSWMTFFSSRNNLAAKRVTDGQDSGQDSSGMEVMEVPDEVGGTPDQGSFAQTSTATPTRPRTTSSERNGAGEMPSTNTRTGKDSTPATPLTNSETVKRKVNTNVPPSPTSKKGSSASSMRANSPAPSKGAGGSGKERKKENFVLPTFGDTFFTLPRVMPPPPMVNAPHSSSSRPSTISRRAAAGLTRKTINLVTSLLGTGFASHVSRQPNATGHPPSEEMLRYLEERRERIARTWFGKATSTPSLPSTPSSTSLITDDSLSTKQDVTLTMASGSGSEHAAPATSLQGVTAQSVPLGRIAHKGYHHLGASQPNHESAVATAKTVGKSLPRIWDVLDNSPGGLGELATAKRVVVIGIHGWFYGAMFRTVLGEPTGTSTKLASMMGASIEAYAEKHAIPLEKLTLINLEGEGTVAKRVAKLYQDLLDHPEWVEDVHQADVVFVTTHSQGSIVSTQLIAALIEDGHIRTETNREAMLKATEGSQSILPSHPTKVLCLALCGIHLGPLLYLNTSSLTQPYFTYFESAAARELFEFQDTNSEVSQRYVKALGKALDHQVKFLYIASLDDQVVPIYSGTFLTASHPLILRALYIDGDAYKYVNSLPQTWELKSGINTTPFALFRFSASDFLSNLIVFLLRVRNAGLDDGGLITHLSEATAGSLSGVGHSTPYLNSHCYDLAVRYMFETSGVIPWALRGVISDPAVLSLFASEIAELRQAFDDWTPKTSILKELRRKLEPIQSLRVIPPSPLALHSSRRDEEVDTPGVAVSSKL
ncbi:hypothetical protein FRB99_003008 [Tulasnella sp. 403]|nr:hypothetical protein FRB99_003008 [Tulasnella sp. 403]